MTAEDELLARYVEAALERRERGEHVDAAAICAAHPHLAVALEEALGLASALPGLQREASERDRLEGRVLRGRYRLAQRLGAGAMGAVYRASDLELRREVAVKVLQDGLFARPESVTRFAREAEALAALRHDHIVGVHDVGVGEDGLRFLVMDLLAGETLAQRLAAARPRAPLPQLVTWVAELASALAAAHAVGIAHRDVKPSNAFLRADGRVVLLDFGIAARAGDGALTLTHTALGTPWYMAPEQAAGRAADGVALDVYGLGATLYHLLAGRPPFDDEPARVLARLQTEEPPPVQSFDRDLPADLIAIVETAMAREPERRYPTMAAFAADLRAFLEHRPVSVRPLTPLRRAWRRARRHPARALAAAAGLAALVVLGVTVPAKLRERETARTTLRNRELPDLALRFAVAARTDVPDRSLPLAAELQRLDHLLEVVGDDVAARLVRALERIRRAQDDGAREDLAVVARTGGPLARELARRLGAAIAAGVATCSLEGLPEPGDDFDRFAFAHFVGCFRDEPRLCEAERQLRAARDYDPAQELRAQVLLALGDHRGAEQHARSCEGRFGKTMLTRHVIGAALVGQKQYQEALEPLRESFALSHETFHNAAVNLGVALRALGRLDEAETMLQRADALRPGQHHAMATLAMVQCDRGDFDAARGTVTALIPPREQPWLKPQLLANVELKHALADLEHGRPRAQRAAELYREALQQGAAKPSLRGDLALVRALLQDQPRAAVVRALLEALAEDPTKARHLANVAALLDEQTAKGLDPRTLQDFLFALARHFAPGDPRVQEPAATRPSPPATAKER